MQKYKREKPLSMNVDTYQGLKKLEFSQNSCNFTQLKVKTMKELKIRDLTLRDGQQSLFATRMNQAQVDHVLPLFKEAGFYAMEVWGGAVPDSIMRYLNEDPWERLAKIKDAIGTSSKLTALSRGRNLFGYNPYPEHVIEGFIKNAMSTGIDILRIFDALNDMDNIRSSVGFAKKYGGIADGTISYTVDPKLELKKKFFGLIKEKPKPPVFTVDYFVGKAKEIEAMGADMITLKDMAGLVDHVSAAKIIRALKNNVKIPVDFHTHSTPGYGLASVLTAMMNGADIIDTNMMPFAGGSAAPAYEIIHLFCKKLGYETNVNIEVLKNLSDKLEEIRHQMDEFDSYKMFPRSFDLTKDKLPAEIEKVFDRAINSVEKENYEDVLQACNEIEAYFNFPAPNEMVKNAQIPGGMYTNMLAQLKAVKMDELLPRVLMAVPAVRTAAGSVPLVTPTSQIVGVQAVNCILDENKGLPWYTNVNTQYVNLVKGSYGKTPVPIDPDFREKITGSREEVPYNTDKYKPQVNKVLSQYGDRNLVNSEKDQLLLELFPAVAEPFLTDRAKKEWDAEQAIIKAEQDAIRAEEERKREEERAAFEAEKAAYKALSKEEKEKRLLDGLYNYKWFTF